MQSGRAFADQLPGQEEEKVARLSAKGGRGSSAAATRANGLT
jgi:hypothetical protein